MAEWKKFVGRRVRAIATMILAAGVLALCACSGLRPDSSSTTTTSSVSNQMPSIQLSAQPSTVNAGTSVTLTWTSSNAATVTIDNGVGTMQPAAGGSTTVTPSTTTTYTATATNTIGSAKASTTVTVNTTTPPPATPTVQLTLTPDAITQGQNATLAWSSTNATSVTIDNGIGSVGPNG